MSLAWERDSQPHVGELWLLSDMLLLYLVPNYRVLCADTQSGRVGPGPATLCHALSWPRVHPRGAFSNVHKRPGELRAVGHHHCSGAAQERLPSEAGERSSRARLLSGALGF